MTIIFSARALGVLPSDAKHDMMVGRVNFLGLNSYIGKRISVLHLFNFLFRVIFCTFFSSVFVEFHFISNFCGLLPFS